MSAQENKQGGKAPKNKPKNNKAGGGPRMPKPPQEFQPKVFALWLIMVASLAVMWLTYAPQMQRAQSWSINEVITAARAGQIESIILKPDTSGGPDFYNLRGTLRADGTTGLPSTAPGTQSNINPAFNEFQADSAAAAGNTQTDTADLRPALQAMVGTGNNSSSEGAPRFTAKGRLTEARYHALTDPALGISISEEPATTLMRDLLLGILPFILVLGLLYFLLSRQMKGAGKGAMGFGKSRAKLLTQDKQKATFKDVAGCDEAKVEVSEIVDFLREPKKFQEIGGRVPKGVLMVGPPGTGKTLLAKAVAGEAKVPFFSISGSDFVEMFVGVGAARVRDMFEQGRKQAPCILFIDEIDAVGRQRGAGMGGGNDEREQTLNSILVEMDGFDAREGVIIIAATNRPDVLDPALLRPGRFDRQVTIDLPDVKGREEILAVHAKKIKLDEDVSLPTIARTTPGFSGADLENLLNEGALLAARHNKKKVEAIDIEYAREKISFGTERKKLMDDEDKKMTAYHEAGHALVQVLIDDGQLPLHKVTIIPRGRALGLTMMMPKKDILGQKRSNLLNQVCMAMAGRIGEEVATGDFSSGASGDIKQATSIARHMVCDWGMSDLGPVALGENQDHVFLGREIARSQNYSEVTAREIDAAVREIITVQYKRAQELVKANTEALEKIAQALLQYETLEGKHVQEILEHGNIQSPVHTVMPDKADADADKKAEPENNESGQAPTTAADTADKA